MYVHAFYKIILSYTYISIFIFTALLFNEKSTGHANHTLYMPVLMDLIRKGSKQSIIAAPGVLIPLLQHKK
jgi:hypothetical protein